LLNYKKNKKKGKTKMSGFNKGGFGGGFGGGNFQQLLKQAQKMQEDMTKTRSEIDEMEVSAYAGGNLVEVIMYGNKKLKKINIKKEAVDIDDLEMLEDLIMVAFNDALGKIEVIEKEKLPQMPTGM